MVGSFVSRQNTVVFLFVAILLARIAPVFAGYLLTGSAVFDVGEYDPLFYLGGARSILATGMNEFPFFAPLNFSFIAGLLYLGRGHELVPVLATAFCGWLSVVVLYYMALDLFNRITAFWVAVLAGFYPGLVFYGINLYPETLAIFFITCSLACLVRYFKTGLLFYVVYAGILWGLASQTRGGVHFFSVGMCCAVIAHVRYRGWAACIKPVCTLFVSIYAVVFLLGIFFAPFNPGMALNSQSGMGSVLHGANRMINCNSDYGMARESLFYVINTVGEPWPEGAQVYSAELMQHDSSTIVSSFLGFILQDPWAYVTSGFERLSFLWSPNQLIIKYVKFHMYHRLPLAADSLCLAVSALFVALLCAGCLGFASARDDFRVLFALFFLFYCALIFFSVGNAKLRLPLMPFVLLYAGYFCCRIFERGAAFKNRAFFLGTLVCGLFILNGMYRYKDIALSPAEFYVRQMEVSLELGFPQTARFLVEKNAGFPHYTEQQRMRLNTLRHKLYEKDQQ
jgi:4-amino-4-deoxy-L-arabinose transferase-like glycosyltransferase